MLPVQAISAPTITSVSSQATPQSGIVLIEKVLRVYDGDTFIADLKNCDVAITCKNIPVRLLGIDTPEMVAKCHQEKEKAESAKQYLKQRLENAKIIMLTRVKRDKYFRLDATVIVDGTDVAADMVNSGLAVKYTGGRRQSWCTL